MNEKLPDTSDARTPRGERQRSLNLIRLISAAAAIESQDADEAGTRAYMARVLVQASLPHSKPDDNEFERTNGDLTIHMMAPRAVGLPYGASPRLALTWLTTEAVRTKSRVLDLGDDYASFLRSMGKDSTGGAKGSRKAMHQQMDRLFSTSIRARYRNEAQGVDTKKNLPPILDEMSLWWDPKNPNQPSLYRSTVKLGEEFFRQLVDRPVPIDLRAMTELARLRSPMAMDVYAWLTHRFSYLKRDTEIPWEYLHAQFGADYARVIDFKRKFAHALRYVLQLYPSARVEVTERALVLRPSPTHVPMLGR